MSSIRGHLIHSVALSALLVSAATAACAPPPDPPLPPSLRGADVNLPADLRLISARVFPGATMASLLRANQIAESEVTALVARASTVFDLRRVRLDQPYRLARALDGALRWFEYEIDADRLLKIARAPDLPVPEFVAAIVPIEKESRTVTVRGTIGTDADSLAFDRSPAEYRCAPLVQLRLVEDWAATIARHYLYETADRIRLEDLKASDDSEVAVLAGKTDREEFYYPMHAGMWAAQLREEGRFVAAVDALWPQALGLLEPGRRGELAARVGREEVEAVEREVTDEFDALWQEMTSVRRSAPAGAQW